jgi:hypothetical protein
MMSHHCGRSLLDSSTDGPAANCMLPRVKVGLRVRAQRDMSGGAFPYRADARLYPLSGSYRLGKGLELYVPSEVKSAGGVGTVETLTRP